MGFEATEDYIESRIGVHDRTRFEVKLDYGLNPDTPKTQYRVEAYFFIPKQLGIHQDSYSNRDFFSDTQAYIRFKTPVVELNQLCQSDEPHLLEEIREKLSQVRRAPRENEVARDLNHDIKLLGAVTRAHLRDQVNRLDELLSQAHEMKKNEVLIEDCSRIITALLDEVGCFTQRLRSLRPLFMDGKVINEEITDTFLWVDEYISLSIETNLTELIRALDQYAPRLHPRLVEVREPLKKLLLDERSYRTHAGYTSLYRGQEDEHFLFRLSRLKKFVMSVLWLEITKHKEGRRVSDILAMIAAGFAMFFAVVLTAWQTRWLGVNTWAFVFAATVTYMFKDRIKDWLKRYFSEHMTGWLADYRLKIKDPVTDSKIGICREAFSFLSESQIPREVWQERHGEAPLIEAKTKKEVVFKYEKAVSLEANALTSRLRQSHHEVNDILRFDLSRFLLHLDDPTETFRRFDAPSDVVRSLELPRVYHLNLVLKKSVQGLNAESVLEHVRVILNKEGIRRLEFD